MIKAILKKEGEIPGGLALWLGSIHKGVQKVRKDTGYKSNTFINKEWKKLLSGKTNLSNSISNQKNAPAGPPPCTSTFYQENYGPLLTTEWGQGCYYNDYCPLGTSCGGHTWTGCVATAMAQIMMYHKKPSTYNWAIMLNRLYSANSEVARLMHDVGVTLNMQYGNDASGTYEYEYTDVTTDPLHWVYYNGVPKSLTQNYGYSGAGYKDFDDGELKSNIINKRPCIVSGSMDKQDINVLGWTVSSIYSGNHTWVCDGYSRNWGYSCPDDYYPTGTSFNNITYHMNWGWGESYSSYNYNGWYTPTSWQPYTSNQNYIWNHKMITINP